MRIQYHRATRWYFGKPSHYKFDVSINFNTLFTHDYVIHKQISMVFIIN